MTLTNDNDAVDATHPRCAKRKWIVSLGPLRFTPILRVFAVVAGLCALQLAVSFSSVAKIVDPDGRYLAEKQELLQIESVVKSLPAGFNFIPNIKTRPVSKYAIMTLLTGPDISSQDPKQTDNFCLGALFHAYTFLHNNLTKLQPSDNTEYVVIMTPGQPLHCRNALLNLGVRILEAPVIPPPDGKFDHRYHYTYSKYQMWALEGVYERILYLDGDLLYLTQSPVELFHAVDVWHQRKRLEFEQTKHLQNSTSTLEKLYFYGGIADWQLGEINGGLLLFEPSHLHLQGLIDLMPTTTGFGDQRTLGEYYKPGTARAPVYLPRRFNTQWVHHRTQQELVEAVGFHHKFFDDRTGEKEESRQVFQAFSQGFLELRRIQVENLASGKGGVLPVVPVVPGTFEGMRAVRGAKTRFDRVAVVGLGKGGGEGREAFARHYSQAVHVDVKVGSLFEKIGVIANRLLEEYEWVWVVDSRVRIKLMGLPIHTALNGWTKGVTGLVVFRDCVGGGTGSFFVGKAARAAMAQLYAENTAKGAHPSDEEVWKHVLEALKDKTQVHDRPKELYEFEDADWFEDSDCSSFLNATLA
ncbi:hypothetical protein HDU98_002314 [Podochytrium sp. JEL0797]|nr:hypothetical protein HDU98_002314 [Podochytrium sp. JEL0797]